MGIMCRLIIRYAFCLGMSLSQDSVASTNQGHRESRRQGKFGESQRSDDEFSWEEVRKPSLKPSHNYIKCWIS